MPDLRISAITTNRDIQTDELNRGLTGMLSIIVALSAVCAGTVGLVYAIANELPLTHMGLSAAVATFIAYLAFRENNNAIANGKDIWFVAAINATFMGVVWAWGALALAVFYNLELVWKEWWQFFAVSLAVTVLCLVFSLLLKREGAQKPAASQMLNVSRYLAMGQLAGMLIAMLGLIVDGKMIRYLTPRYTDWAANNVFFFGAFALALISYIALRSHNKLSS